MKREVIVFAKPPREGRVKTRLAADLGAEGAAAVYHLLLEHAVRVAQAGRVWQTRIAWSERPSGVIEAMSDESSEIQVGRGLGERMANAFESRFSCDVEQVLLVGSDVPGMTACLLQEAFERLEEQRVVLGPAGDGGYWLVGQRAPGVDLFAGIPWSSRRTLEATRDRLRSLAVEFSELPVVADVDTLEDLRRVLAADVLDSGLADALRQTMVGSRV